MAAVMVVPIVSYYYDIINPVTGETEPFVVNTSYTPAFANISVEKYNNTASQYNNKLDEGEPALSLINLDEMYFEGYQAGDPSSYPNKTDDIKGIEGDDFRVSDNVSVDVNGDGSIELSFADSVGETQTNGFNVSLAAGATFHAEVGLKVLGIGGAGYLDLSAHVAGSYGYSYAVTESEGFSYAGNLINLPAAAQTGTDEYGNPTSDYAYSARLVQWNHTQNVLAEADENGEVVSQKVPYIGYITTTLLTPPRRVQDLKVLTTTKHSALLKWTKPEDREVNGETISVDSYKIYMSTDPNGEFTAVQKDGKDVEIAGNSTSYLVSGLEAGVTYYFKLQSLTEMKDGSSLSKVAVGTTKKSTAPIITKHPDDIVAEGIDYPEYKVAARSFETNSTLTYQWQKKEGNSWVELEGATETTFNPAYHPETNPTGILQGYGDALIGSDNNYLSLDGAEYRCAVTETQAGGAKETIYSNSATLDVVEAYAGKTNVELRMTGYPFESDGDVYQIVGGQVQLNYKFIDQPDLFDTPVTIILVNAETGEFVEGFPMDVKTEEYNASGNIFLNTLEKGVYYAIAEYEGNNSIMPTSSVAEVIHITDEIHIDYELNGGTNSVYNPDVLSMETEAFGLYAPQKENHEFLGWYYDKELTKPLDGAEQNVLYPSESTSDSITVYAAWEENKYSVTYELNGGVNGDNPTEIAAGDVVTLKEASKEGYAFEGWYLDKEYTIPCEAVSGAEKKDIIVYAKWSEPVAYAIQYMTGEGVNAESNPLTYTIESEEIVFADASRKGYEFMGWYKDAELTEKITGIPSGSTGDVIVYADWKLIDQLEPNADGVYEIDSYEDLVAMAEMVKAAPEKYAKASYEQTANIQCGMQEWSLAIGSADAPFEGTYEGNDYYILALRPTSSAAGVFGVIGENGIVRNLSVVDFDYEEEARVAGGLAGVNFGTIDGCGSGINLNSAATIYRNGEEVPISTLDSIIRASKCAGGLVAVNEGIIRNSRSSADIVMGESEEENYAGGIAGFNEGTIINVYHTGAITGGNYAGGIAGANDGTIQYGYNAGSVTGTTAGGIAGMSSNTEIQDMYYADNMERACGDQEDSSLGVTKKTVDTMKSQEFADELNELISDVEGLTEWDYSETKNEGYPRNVKDNTVTAIRQNVQFVNPEDGEEPSDPDNPADPEKPDKPDKPDKPNKPTKPDSPSKPGAAFVNIIRKAVQTISKWFGWLFRR